MRGGGSSPWFAILIALVVVAVIYSIDLIVTDEGPVEHWDDLLLPIAITGVAAAIVGWRVGARRADDVRRDAQRDIDALVERNAALQRELDELRGGTQAGGRRGA